MEATGIQIKKLRADAILGKKKHFNAADRKASLSNWVQVPALVINAVLSSVLLSNLQKAAPEPVRWFTAALAVVATILTALTAYWKLAKQVEGHRRVAGKFLKVAKGCERLWAAKKDSLIDGAAFAAGLENLASLYDDATSESEGFETNGKDFDKARKGIESGEESYLPGELEL
jgi:hypothetical protein